MSQVAISGNASGTGTLTIAAPNTNSNYTLTLPAATGTVASIASVNNNGVVYANSSGQPTTGTAFVFDGTNVGIGTSSPSYALDIRSSSLSGALGVNLTSGTTLTTAQGSTTNVDMAFVTKGVGLYTWTQGSTERMRIDSSGNLLIGTTSLLSTTERLSIVNSNNAMINVRNSGATAGRYWNIQADSSNTFYIYNASNAGVYITNGGTSWSSSSDENLKNITGEIQNGLSKVCSLRAAEFTWKTDEESKPQVGLIAQDVEKVLPQVVDTSPEGYLGVRYSETVPLLVAAIKEQQALITQLQADVAALKGK